MVSANNANRVQVLFAIIVGTAGIGVIYIICNVIIRTWTYFKVRLLLAPPEYSD